MRIQSDWLQAGLNRIVWGERVFNMDLSQYVWLTRTSCRFCTLMFAAFDLIIVNTYVDVVKYPK
jgi:hypothetical protein